MLYIGQLIWDNGNIAHIARHQMVPEEVEQVCHSEPILWQAKAKKDRLFNIGPTSKGRVLVVILDKEDANDVYYVVTARTANRAERQMYQQQKEGEEAA